MPFTLRTERLEIAFGDSPLHVERMVHRQSGREVSPAAEQRLLLRLPKAPSDPIFLTEVRAVQPSADAVAFSVADEDGRYTARVRIITEEQGLRFDLTAEGPEPIWMAEWALEGLALDEVVVPALGGQALTAAMPGGTQVSYKYPFWWNAQFALGEFGDATGGVWLRTMEAAPHFKMLRVHKVEGREDLFALGLGFEADAPLTTAPLEATFYLDGYAGDWRAPVGLHRQWLAETFGLVPYREHPHFPAWADDITFVLEVWGMRKDRGRPAHTFDATIRRIEAFAEQHPPEQTLLYLPGFAEEGIDSRIPDYNPSTKLGGAEGLKGLVDRAHALGYRVMVHTNVLGMTYTHPRFPEFAQHQVVDVFGRPMGWGNDLDGDWLPEPYFAYINPGAEAWGDLMEETLGHLIREAGVDAVFLDQTLLAFNVSEGPNFLEGMRDHVARLQAAFPDVLFAGEGLNEQVLPVLPFVQIHGIDSIAEVHGMEGEKPWRRVHPVSTTLFGPHTRFVAHLLTKHPSSPGFAGQETAYAELGVVPGLVLYRPSQGMAGPEVEAMLARARRSSKVTA